MASMLVDTNVLTRRTFLSDSDAAACCVRVKKGLTLMNGSFEVASVEETWEVARRLAAELGPGDVVCLEGDLGAGKTTFVQGMAAAMGVGGRVISPTFCLVSEHRGGGRLLVHMDLYRLRGEEDVLSVGWEDYLAEGAVIAVEWPDRAGSLIPATARRVRISAPSGAGERRTIEIA